MLKSVLVSVLLGEELTSLPGWGAELEEGLCCFSLQGGEECAAVPIVTHREELGTPQRACRLSSPYMIYMLTDVCYCNQL